MLRSTASAISVVFLAVATAFSPVSTRCAMAAADDALQFPGEKSQWNGFDRYDFTVDGRKCLVVVPKTAARERPWIWRTEFFGHEPQADIALLDKGFCAVYMDVQDMYGLTEAEALAYKLNPVDNLAPLAKAGVPLLHVAGDADDVVPLEENTLLVEQGYKALKGPIQVIVKQGVGHHPHSLKDPKPIVDFILEHTKPAG